MKVTSPTPTRDPKPRTARARRRAARSFAPGPSALEWRVMPSTLGIPDPGTASGLPAEIGPLLLPGPGPGLGGDPAGSFPSIAGFPRWGGGGDRGPSPHDRMRGRVGMAEADVRIEGKLTPEFAFADQSRGVVVVKVGRDGPATVLSAGQGIKAPSAVVLADVNGDGIPDLVLANTGGDNVLVFPGLPGGGVGPEVGGGAGFAVGRSPAGVTVGDVNGDGIADLVVANRGSNDVTILLGRGEGADWTLTPGASLAAGSAPVRTALQDVNADGKVDLFILDSGSHDVTIYRGRGDGTFDTANPTSFGVGLDPAEMFVGRFDRRPGLDLVTVNSGSNDLTFIARIASGSPQSLTFPSGGTTPEAAFAVDLNHDGMMDLVVANDGDGRLALLQSTGVGLQLSGVISRTDLPAPTAVAPGSQTGAGLDFFAAGAGQDAAELLHFDLGPASAFLAPTPDPSGTAPDSEEELVAQLLPFGASDLELIAVLWEGGRAPRATSPEGQARGPSPVPCSVAEDHGSDGIKPGGNPADPPGPPPVDPNLWARYVLGLDLALAEPRGDLEPVSDRDAAEAGDDPGRGVARVAPAPVDPDLEAVDEALRSLRSETLAPAPVAPDPGPAGPGLPPDPARQGLEGADAPAREPGTISVPLVASSVLLASGLILKATPPRPPSIRRGTGRRIVATARDRSDREQGG